MAKINLSRRSFLKVTAATAVAASLTATAAPGAALAETATATGSDIKRIRSCCRGCGKMECGVWVTVENGRAVKIEGDESAIQSNGNCCAKSQSSLQAAYHPDRLRYPMKRTNPKGEDPGWQRISWDEALDICHDKLLEQKERYGGETFTFITGTSRQWGCCSFLMKDVLEAINDMGANEICKGPRIEAGAMTIERGIHFQAIEDRPLVYVQWGTDQTQSNYDNSCRSTVEAANRAQVFISVDPRVSNCGKEADYHLALRPGTDGAMLMAWTRIVMEEELYDDLLVKRWSNAPFLHVEELEPTGWTGVSGNISREFLVKTRLLKESDLVEGGDPKKFMVWDNLHGRLTYFDANEEGPHAGMWEGQTEHDIATTGFEYEMGGWVPDPMPFPVDIDPALWGEFDVTLKDGRTVKAQPVWQKYWNECVDEMTLERAAEICDVDAQLIYDACKAWATRIDPRRGNGGLNVQLAPEQVGRAIQNFRTMYNLVFMTDNYDTPGGNRGSTYSPIVSDGCTIPYMEPPKVRMSNWEKRARIVGADKFPMTRWYGAWVDCTSVWDAVHTGEPYPITAAIASTGNFMNQSNATYGWEALKKLDFFMVIDLWEAPQATLADVLLPAQHWLEIPGFPRASQGAHGGFGLTAHCIEPLAEARFEEDILNGLYKRFGVPFYNPATGDPWDRPIEAWLDSTVENTGMTWAEYYDKFQKDGWWSTKKECPERWGTYRRFQMGYLRGNSMGPVTGMPGMGTPTMKAEMWSTILESCIDREEMPRYEEPPLSPVSTPELFEEYPFNCTTGRRTPVYFHSEHRQLPWCREQWPVPRMEINPEDAAELGLEQGDWAWIESKDGKIRQTVDLCYGVRPGVINLEHTWWYPELNQPGKGYELSACNCLVDRYAQDPLVGSSQLRAYPVKVYKATAENSPFGNPCPCGNDGIPIIADSSDPRLKNWLPVYEGREA